MVRRPHAVSAAIVFAIALSASALAAPVVTTVATGLDNPKGVAIGPDGGIYVALSGHASPVDPVLDGFPYNHTGAVVRVSSTGTVSTVLYGLLSRFDEGSAIGPSGLAWWNGSGYIAQGLYEFSGSPTGTLISAPVVKATPPGSYRTFTSFQALVNDPTDEAGYPDTNPFGCAVGSDNLLYVSDGGENAVWRVEANGDNSLLVQIPGDPTVAGIAAIPRTKGNGRFGTLPKFTGLVICVFGNGRSGFANGNVQTFDDRGLRTLVPTGVITMPIQAAYSPSGHLYVLQFATPATTPGPPFAFGTGAVWAIGAGGAATKVVSGLIFPTGMAFTSDGTAWISNDGVFGATGEVTGSLVKVTGLP